MNKSVVAKAVLLVLCLFSSLALAQAEGEVESIGFAGYYRPNCWTPMKLRLRPTIGRPMTYKIAVMQEDMDRDRVLYSRPFTLNGNPEGARITERVWVYFLPQPRDLNNARNMQELSNFIKVFLCKEDGTQLVQLQIPPGTPRLLNLDEPAAFGIGSQRGARFILTVGTSQSKPLRDVYTAARGITEEVVFESVAPSELPQNVLGYQAVDAIVWMDADPTELQTDTVAAIQEYVTNGGKLVVTQNADWQRMKESELAPLLPVELTGVTDEKGLVSLRRLAELPRLAETRPAETRPAETRPAQTRLAQPARPADQPGPDQKLRYQQLPFESIFSQPNNRILDPWADTVNRVVPIAKATVRPGAVVSAYQASDPAAPYLARWMHGHGTVVWAAQDFGDPKLISATEFRHVGWQRVWDKVFDWPHATITQFMAGLAARERKQSHEWFKEYNTVYKNAMNNTDVSSSLLGAMELPRRGAALVALAVVFFIGYWLVAGPGSYFFLLAKNKSRYSWIAFAACAVIATGLTILVVRLVLRGPPQLQHVTFVRVTPGQDAVVNSDFGLYIPRDGMQRIELRDTSNKRSAYVTPFPVHPVHLVDTSEYPAYMEYEVPVPDRTSETHPSIQVPYRSTLKKFQARWVGKLSTGAIDGKARLADTILSGVLSNNTGLDLHNVYIIYNAPMFAARSQPGVGAVRPNFDDWVIWLPDGEMAPAWPKGATIDLGSLRDRVRSITGQNMAARSRDQIGDRGTLNGAFAETQWKAEYLGIQEGNRYGNLDRAALLMTVFDRLQPVRGKTDDSVFGGDRFELHRRSGRHLDASAAISVGHLLVLARSAPSSPLPYPLYVEGDLVPGEGTTYYQFVIPMERTGAATRPSGYLEDEEDEEQPEDGEQDLDRIQTVQPPEQQTPEALVR